MEKHLEVLVDHRLSNTMLCQVAANKPSKILSCNKKCIHLRDKSIIVPLTKHWFNLILNMQFSFGQQSSGKMLLNRKEFTEEKQN